MTRKRSYGVSLIVLLITIIIMIILASAVVLSLNNNQIGNAKKSTFQNDLKAIQSEIDSYVASQSFNNFGEYDRNNLKTEDLNNLEIIKDNPKYQGKFEIKNGELVLKSSFSDDEKKWAKEIGIDSEN